MWPAVGRAGMCAQLARRLEQEEKNGRDHQQAEEAHMNGGCEDDRKNDDGNRCDDSHRLLITRISYWPKPLVLPSFAFVRRSLNLRSLATGRAKSPIDHQLARALPKATLSRTDPRELLFADVIRHRPRW